MRQSWDDYFLQMAVNVASRATCPRLHVGAVLTWENRVVGTGYNGSLPAEPHCDESGCLMVDNHCIRTIHAEENAVHNALGRPADTCYCTHYPCLYCLKTLLAYGVKRIVYADQYKPYPARDVFVANYAGQLEVVHKPLSAPWLIGTVTTNRSFIQPPPIIPAAHCTCGKPWWGVVPPPPCPVHGPVCGWDITC